MYKLVIASLEEILTKKLDLEGWLYLADKPWQLDTEGFLIFEDIDADPNAPFPPKILEKCGMREVLDAASIEDIIINAELQLQSPSAEQLLSAFIFYVDNDAFIDFTQHS